MATWQTPITNWKSVSLYNLTDFERTRDNLICCRDWLIAHGYGTGTLNSLDTSQGRNTIPTVELLNKLEQNLTYIYNGFGVPFESWEDSKTWYAKLDALWSSNPTSSDWNRWEQISLSVYEALAYIDAYLYGRPAATFYAGSDQSVQFFSRGR